MIYSKTSRLKTPVTDEDFIGRPVASRRQNLQHSENTPHQMERKELGKDLSFVSLFVFPFSTGRRENLRRVLVRFFDRDDHIRPSNVACLAYLQMFNSCNMIPVEIFAEVLNDVANLGKGADYQSVEISSAFVFIR